MQILPVFIKVHDLADDTIVYRINSNSIDYYCALHSPDHMTHYTFIKFNGEQCVRVSESVEDIDCLLGVVDDE